MAARKVAWNWRDVGVTAAPGKNASATKRLKAKQAEQTPMLEVPSPPAAKPQKVKQVKGKRTAEQPALTADAQENQPAMSPLAALAKIADAEGWTLDEALSQAVNTLNRHLYGKADHDKA